MRQRVENGLSIGVEDEGKEWAKPGDWHAPQGVSNKEKLEQAVTELMRRQPDLTKLQAVQKIGAEMNRALNAPNEVAAHHFRVMNTRAPSF